MEQKTQAYKDWILKHCKAYALKDEGDKLYLSTSHAEAVIRFHTMNIIEFQITRKDDQEIVFYLHFQLNDEEHAKKLFGQFQECMANTGPVSKIRVLLCCSSALTTSFFAQKLNQTSDLVNLPYTYAAVSYNRLYEVGVNYDFILLAPQIAFYQKECQERFGSTPVREIPASLFGTYDVRGIINLISSTLSSLNAVNEIQNAYVLKSSHKILAITTRIDTQFKISYRLYDDGKIIRSETIIKDAMDYHDFEDILDFLSVYEKDIETVVLSVPGVVHNGAVILASSNFEGLNIKAHLSEKYPYRFIITNNANATALGLYHLHKNYNTVVYHSQLKAGDKAGQGIVINGMIVKGKNGIAGEVNYLLENSEDTKVSTPLKAAKAVANAIISDIAIIGPDAVFIRCELIHDTRKIRELIQEKIEDQYIPDLFILDHATEYMYYGSQIMASGRYKE